MLKIMLDQLDGDRPPSWSCLGHIWTTHREYLIVSVSVLQM